MTILFKRFLLGVFLSFACCFSGYAQYSVTFSKTNSCAGDGTITVDMVGGTMPYEIDVYSNGLPSRQISSVNQSTYTITNLINAVYFVSVIDANRSEHQQLISIDAAFHVDFTLVPDNCNGNGSVTAVPSGGSAPYTYAWSNGNTTATISNVKAYDRFQVNVTDASGCVFYSADSLETLSNFDFSINTSSTDASCGGKGTATANVVGPADTYTYNWLTSPPQTTATATELNAEQDYTVIVTNSSGCSRQTTAYVNRPYNEFDLTVTETAATCQQADGSISVVPAYGAAPYDYSWSNGASTAAVSNLTGGSYYTVTATDANSCRSIKYIYLPVASPLQASFTTTNAPCGVNGGTAQASVSGGTAPYSYYWTNGELTASATNLTTGINSVDIQDVNGCKTTAYIYVGEDANCKAIISGKMFIDDNRNGIMDQGEQPFDHGFVTLSDGNGYYCGADGTYSFMVSPGDYNLNSYTPTSEWDFTSSPNITLAGVVGGNIYANNNFGMAPNTAVSNFYINAYAYPYSRPGCQSYVNIYYGNEGTITESATITYTFQNGYDYLSASPSPTNYDPLTNTATWTISNMQPLEDGYIMVNTEVPSNTALGATFTVNASITTAQTDVDLSNNHSVSTTTVYNSYDPNYLQVSPQGSGSEGYISDEQESLVYQIEFQNTGTASAINVVVTNDIDDNLDNTTVSILSSSDPCMVSMEENTLKFKFDNINLPDSNSNELGSHGYVTYRIHKKSGLAPDTKIYNEANIYFDYNVPVATNQVFNTIARTTAVVSVDQNEQSFTLYPNPCKDIFSMQFNSKEEGKASVILYSTAGQQMAMVDDINVKEGNNTIPFDLSTFNLSNGLYVAKVLLSGQVFAKQFIVSH